MTREIKEQQRSHLVFTLRSFSLLPHLFPVFLLSFFLQISFFTLTNCCGASPPNILIINSYNKGLTWTDDITNAVESELEGKTIFVEYMDAKRHSDKEYLDLLQALFRKKYKNVHLDVIISTDDHALSFLLAKRDNLFPGVPIVFCGVNDYSKEMLIGKKMITGVVESFDIQATIKMALKLHPHAKKVVIINDTTLTGQANKRVVERLLPSFDHSISFDIVEDISMTNLRGKVQQLPTDSIIFLMSFTRDVTGQTFDYDTSVQLIAEKAAVPIYGIWDFYLKKGIIGGKLTNGKAQGEMAAHIAEKIIGGTGADDLPVVTESPNLWMFDYNQLSRFKIPVSSLPEKSVIVNQPRSIYREHPLAIWSTLGVIIALATLSTFLLVSIAKRKIVEKQLRDNQQFILGITSNVPGAVYQFFSDASGHYGLTHISDKALEIFDIETTPDKFFTSFASKIHPEDQEHFLSSIAEAIQHVKPWHFEGRYVKHSNQTIWFSGNSVPHLENDLVIFDGVLMDITNLKTTEEKLRKSEQLMAQIINFLPNPTFVIDKNGRVITWNLAMEELTAIKAEAMLGKGNYEYALPFYGERRPIMIDLVSTWNEEISNKYRNISKIGEHFVSETQEANQLLGNRHFRTVAGPLYDREGNVAGAIETLHDITHQRRTEQKTENLYNETKKNLAFIKAMLSAIPSPVYFKDTDFRFLGCNSAYLEIQGFTEEEIIGKTVHDIYPKEFADIYREKDVLLLQQAQRQEYETEVLNKYGQKREVIFAKDVFRDHNGNVAGLVGSFMDISELKNAEKEKEKLEAQLGQSQKLEALGTLAGGVAHDFNNILSAVLGYSELGMKEINDAEQSPLYIKFQSINQAGIRAKQLVQQILAFSRMQEQLQVPVKMAVVVKEVVTLLKSSFPTDIVIEVQCNTEKKVLGDPTQLHQIIMNLCTNAYHAMQRNGGIINIKLDEVVLGTSQDPAEVDLSPGQYLRLTVSDTGSGISPLILNRIFDPYFTTKEKNKGTGLGLAVVHGMVKRHNGDIIVQSRVDAGTQFYVYLPISHTELGELHTSEVALRRGSEHVLLVDNEKEIIQIGEEMLRYLGYTVTGITGSIAGLHKFKEDPYKYDVVISDYDMPAMKGDQLAMEILKIRSDIPIMICTGFTERLSEEQAKSIGIRKFLMKPMTMRDMSEGIREVLPES